MMWMMKDGRRVPWSDLEGMKERREALSDLKGVYKWRLKNGRRVPLDHPEAIKEFNEYYGTDRGTADRPRDEGDS